MHIRVVLVSTFIIFSLALVKQVLPEIITTPLVPMREGCPGNQQFYRPDDYGDKFGCGCTPGHIYYPPAKDCFKAFSRGPCSKGQILIFRRGKVECVRNSCKENFVRWAGKCFELGAECEDMKILIIDVDTLWPKCIDVIQPLNLISTKCNEGWEKNEQAVCVEKCYRYKGKCREIISTKDH